MQRRKIMSRNIVAITLTGMLVLMSSFCGVAQEVDMIQAAERERETLPVTEEQSVDLNNPDERYVIALSQEEIEKKRAEISAKIEQDLPQLQEKWTRLEAQGITYTPGQTVAKAQQMQTYSDSFWDNDLPYISGSTMLDGTTRLVLDIPNDPSFCLSENDFILEMQNRMNCVGFPIERLYTCVENGSMYIDRLSIGSFWSYGTYVTACNIPRDLFFVETDNMIWTTGPGSGKIDFKVDFIELYPSMDGGYPEEVLTTHHIMVDVIV